jgi:hypothetical protein
MIPVHVTDAQVTRLEVEGKQLLLFFHDRLLHRLKFRWIERVHVTGEVEVSMKVLRTLANRGVPFIVGPTKPGETAAVLCGGRERGTKLSDCLNSLLSHNDWLLRYHDWRNATQRRAIVRLARATAMPWKRLDDNEARERFAQALKARAESCNTALSDAEYAVATISELSLGLAARVLMEFDVPPQSARVASQAFDLHRDLTALTVLYAKAMWLEWHTTAARKDFTRQAVVQWFEARTRTLRETIGIALQMLEARATEA